LEFDVDGGFGLQRQVRLEKVWEGRRSSTSLQVLFGDGKLEVKYLRNRNMAEKEHFHPTVYNRADLAAL
jgi:hypothetical protein